MANPEDEIHYTKINTKEDQPQPIYETVTVDKKIEQQGVESPTPISSGTVFSTPFVQEPAPVESPEPHSANGGDAPAEFETESNTKLYIVLGIIFVIFIVSVVFIISTLRKKIAPTNVHLVYWGLWEEKSTIQPLINSYQQQHNNVTIEYIKQDPKDYREKVVTRAKDGRGPDLFRFHNTWVPMLSDVIAAIPKNVLTNDEFEKTFYKVAQEDVRVGKSYYGIPLFIDNLVLIYNDDFFKRIGLSGPPKTWDDVVTYAKQLTVPGTDGKLVTSGIALGTANNIEHYTDILGWMLLQNGADIKDLSSIEAEQALKRYREFAEEPDPVWSVDMPNSVAAFTSGKVAMIFAPYWEIANIKAINSDINLKVAQLPVLPGETEPFSIANYWIEGVSRTSKNQKEAWEFLKYISSKDSQIKMFEIQKKTRGFGSLYSRLDLKDTLLQNEYSGPVIDQAPFLKSIPTISRTFDNGLNDQINAYLEDAINDAMAGVSYSEAMKKASLGIGSVLEKFKIK